MTIVTSTADTCLLAVRQTSFRRHELYPGSIMEPERRGQVIQSSLILQLAERMIEWNKTKSVDLYNKSRMTGDCHVRFCERLGVKFPLPTRLLNVVRKHHKGYKLY